MEGFSGPGVKFYRTVVKIDYPLDYDVPLAFVFNILQHVKTRVELFVNGYQMGRYVNHIGPQSVFPVYPGIINRGDNVIGIAIWGMNNLEDGEFFRFTKLSLEALDVFRTGYGEVNGQGLVTALPTSRRKFLVDGDGGSMRGYTKSGWFGFLATKRPVKIVLDGIYQILDLGVRV